MNAHKVPSDESVVTPKTTTKPPTAIGLRDAPPNDIDAVALPPVADVQLRLLTYDEAMQQLRLSRLSVRRIIEAGHIRTVSFGRAVRLRGDDIDALIERGGVDADRLAS